MGPLDRQTGTMDVPASARSAYVHVPFCAHRCGYCNFAVVSQREDMVEPFLRAIDLELAQLLIPREVDTLYIGGGTPTQLPVRELEHLLANVLRWLPLAPGGEFTVEANPEDFSSAGAAVMREMGVNRVSLGAQSFGDRKLASLDRRHREADIYRAIDRVRRIQAALAIDLMFAAPGETLEDWLTDVAGLLSCRPEHASTYGLTWEKGTRFWSQRQKTPEIELDEGLQREMYVAGIERLTAAGYEHYEVSNFALAGQRSRHNQAYWQGAFFYGFGPGAARFLDGTRSMNHRSTSTYIQRVLAGQSPVAESETLVAEEHARERLVFALRMMDGVLLADFEEETGFSAIDLAQPMLDKLVAQGLLARDAQRLSLTRAGLLISDAIWPYFLKS
jgi:oxygen-independent coproporphyrinogen III oxidase